MKAHFDINEKEKDKDKKASILNTDDASSVKNNSESGAAKKNKKRSSRKLLQLEMAVFQEENPFPYHEEMLGTEFFNCKNELVQTIEVFSCPLICLFFHCHWSNPCQLFVNDLKELYKEANQGLKTLEIIQIVIDKDGIPVATTVKEDALPPKKEEDIKKDEQKKEELRKEEELKFKNNIVDKPWLFLPFNDERITKLKEQFNVNKVPSLIVLDRDLTVLTYNGRKELADEGVTVSERWMQLLKKDEKLAIINKVKLENLLNPWKLLEKKAEESRIEEN